MASDVKFAALCILASPVEGTQGGNEGFLYVEEVVQSSAKISDNYCAI